MNAVGNKYHIEIDEEANWKIKMGDTEIFFDPEYRLEYNTIQWGYVLATPHRYRETKEQFGPVADVGSKVYFHHHIHHKDNRVDAVDKEFYIAEPLSMFCQVVDGEINMLNDFVLVKPIDEVDKKTESGIIVETAKTAYVPNKGIVHHVPEHGPGYGINYGDMVHFTDNSEYEIEVEGEKYYCMQLHRDIPYVIESDDTIKMLGDWGIVQPLDGGDDFEENDFGVLVRRKDKVQKHKGKVTHVSASQDWEVVVGDDVLFDRKGQFKTTIKNKEYYCLNIKRDILLLFCV